MAPLFGRPLTSKIFHPFPPNCNHPRRAPPLLCVNLLNQGPSVSSRRDGVAVGPTLWEALDTSFGYLNQEGYCDKKLGECHTFPIAIGEFGSRFADKDVSGGLTK